MSDSGEKLSDLRGDIQLKGVTFCYPARPDATVFSEFDLQLAPGKSTALVGASGQSEPLC